MIYRYSRRTHRKCRRCLWHLQQETNGSDRIPSHHRNERRNSGNHEDRTGDGVIQKQTIKLRKKHFYIYNWFACLFSIIKSTTMFRHCQQSTYHVPLSVPLSIRLISGVHHQLNIELLPVSASSNFRWLCNATSQYFRHRFVMS